MTKRQDIPHQFGMKMVLLTETETNLFQDAAKNQSPLLCMSWWHDGSLIQVDPYDDYAEMPGLLPFLKRPHIFRGCSCGSNWDPLLILFQLSTRLRRALTGLEVGGMCLLPGGWGSGDFMARQYISFVTCLYSFGTGLGSMRCLWYGLMPDVHIWLIFSWGWRRWLNI